MAKRVVKAAPVPRKKAGDRQARLRPSKAPSQVSRPRGAGSKPSLIDQSVLVLINQKSGTVRSYGVEQVQRQVTEGLAKAFSKANVTLFKGDIAPHIRKAIDSKSHDIVIAGGGDGTISSAASLLMDSDITMGALPLGTMNLFVQALGFSASWEEAVKQFGIAVPSQVDVGFANDKPFLHQVSFGLQPRMARLREKIGYSSRFTKMFAAARAFLILMMRPKTVRVALRADNEVRKVKSPLLIVSNNPLGRPGNPSLPVSLEGGRLGLYILDHISLPKLVRLARDYLRSDLTENPAVEALIVEAVELNTPNNPLPGGRKRKGILSSMDGEVVLLQTPVSISIKPRSLRILVMPQTSGDAQD